MILIVPLEPYYFTYTFKDLILYALGVGVSTTDDNGLRDDSAIGNNEIYTHFILLIQKIQNTFLCKSNSILYSMKIFVIVLFKQMFTLLSYHFSLII